LLVDGGAAAQGAVVFGDLLEPLIGHAAPGGDVAQEGDDVVLALGAAEGGEQDRVVDWSAHRRLSVSRRIRWADGADGADRAGRAATSSARARPRPGPVTVQASSAATSAVAANRRPVWKGSSSRTCRRAFE